MADTFGNVHEVTRVVAGRDGADYVVGMPCDDWNPEGISFHLPGFGDVRSVGLACKVHNEYYKLLKFPLTAGESWEAFFEFGNVMVTVKTVETGKATIRVDHPQSATDQALVGQRFAAQATYDVQLGEVSKLDVEGYGSIEIIDHEFGWTGVERPAGTWKFEHLRAEYCLTQSEGFAYDVHDIELPGLAVTRPIS